MDADQVGSVDTVDTSTRAHVDAREFDPKAFVSGARWRTAKDGSHQYTMRADAQDEDDFEAFVTFIRQVGRREPYQAANSRRYWYTYWYSDDGHRYWSMGAALKATILVNRAHLES